MEGLRAALQQADDDYLTGLSNKGILKRAYKDLAEETPSLEWQGEAVKVTLRSETCVIRNPLGGSSCSCPSSGMCRHVVTAILWLKSQPGQGDGESRSEQNDGESRSEQNDDKNRPGQGEKQGNGEDRTDRKEETDPAEKGAASEAPGSREEFLSVPFERLKRACGSRRFQSFLAHVKSGELPEPVETSIVTVEIPWEQASVRLLSPFEYSACTCHSRELCGHKAQALLIYQLKHGKIGIGDLEASEMSVSSTDMALAREAAQKVQEHIRLLMDTGLSRQSTEVEESLERLAIICHRASLADFESRLREIASDYVQYFGRSAAFRSVQLLHRLLTLYKLAGQVLAAENARELASLAGSFRSGYEPVGRLRLTGMGARSFSSKTGYEGEIYYFLERERKKWYTWTDARPVFYEGVRKRPKQSEGSAAAPWGLPCSREQMTGLEFELTGAKAASGGRLSVSQETKGEILGPRNLDDPEVSQMIYEDYEQLLQDYFGPPQSGISQDSGGSQSGSFQGSDRSQGSISQDRGSRRQERLALIQAFGWETPSFDAVSQSFSWGLYDRMGRTIFISLRYTKEEKLTISLLERLEKRLNYQEGRSLLFFGAVYLEGGRLCLYPIEFFRQQSLVSDRQASDTGASDIPAEILHSIEQYRQEAERVLTDLLSSGLSSVQDNVISVLSLLAEDGRRMGLSYAGEELSAIKELLESRRHKAEFQTGPVIEAMERLARYLLVCEEKLSFDRAQQAMRLAGNI